MSYNVVHDREMLFPYLLQDECGQRENLSLSPSPCLCVLPVPLLTFKAPGCHPGHEVNVPSSELGAMLVLVAVWQPQPVKMDRLNVLL